jgi:hypothetical protein
MTSNILLVIPSQKVFENNLIGTQNLKQKFEKGEKGEKMTLEEKGEKEEYFKNIMKKNYKQILEVIPDDIQQIILSFLDINTRLNFIKSKYPSDIFSNKLSKLPRTLQTLRILFKAMKYMEFILLNYYKENEYNEFGFYLNDEPFWLKIIKSQSSYYVNLNYYIDILTKMIVVSMNHYKKMYKKTRSAKQIEINEKNMLKLYLFVLSL